MATTIKSFKGFDKDMKCRGFQYEVGKKYTHEGDISVCNSGFHACENPLDVLNYYSDVNGKFCEVEQSGNTQQREDKIASSEIKIVAEIGFAGLFKAGVEWIKKITNPQDIIKETKDKGDNPQGYSAQIGSSGDSAQIGSSGDYAQIGSSGYSAKIGSSGDSAKIGSSGYYAKIGSSGDSAQIGSSGDYAKIGSSGYSAKIGSSGDSAKIGSSGDSAKVESTGDNSVICCAGHNSVVKAKKGSWITLSEWEYNEEVKRDIPKCVKTEYVDGEQIKADTWYKLVNGEFKEV
ncbi:MAG: hypothetical protein E7083_07550 [Bacteroidales bacterium]|nr:hypothetical protein [Bacteroidales bacterium]